MSRWSAAVAAGCVVVSGAAVLGIGGASETVTAPRRAPEVIPVPRMSLSCPEAQGGRGTRSRILAGTPESVADGQGKIFVTQSRDRLQVGGTMHPGVAIESLVDPGEGAVAVTAEAGLAPGVAAYTWTSSGDRGNAALAVNRCSPAAAAWWFNGIDTSVGAGSRLVLVNRSRTVAVVDLAFSGARGRVDAVGARGVAVAPGSETALDLSRFAPGLDASTLEVAATQGTVTAGVRTSSFTTGGRLQGAEWLPAATAPAKEVLVGATPDGAGDRTLLITNPGTQEALVQVRVIDKDGAFAPTQLKDLQVAPGTVAVNDLRPITKDSAVAIELSSSVPVTAATVSGGDETPEDFAVTVPGPAVDGPVLVPVVDDAFVTLSFASTTRAGSRVSVETFDDAGRSIGRQNVELRGAVVTRWQPPGDDPRAAYLVVSVLAGEQVRGVATYEGSQGLSSVPLVSGVTTVTRPAVYPGY